MYGSYIFTVTNEPKYIKVNIKTHELLLIKTY